MDRNGEASGVWMPDNGYVATKTSRRAAAGDGGLDRIRLSRAHGLVVSRCRSGEQIDRTDSTADCVVRWEGQKTTTTEEQVGRKGDFVLAEPSTICRRLAGMYASMQVCEEDSEGRCSHFMQVPTGHGGAPSCSGARCCHSRQTRPQRCPTGQTGAGPLTGKFRACPPHPHLAHLPTTLLHCMHLASPMARPKGPY